MRGCRRRGRWGGSVTFCRVDRESMERSTAQVVRCSRPGCDGAAVFHPQTPTAAVVRRLRARGWVQGEDGWECENH